MEKEHQITTTKSISLYPPSTMFHMQISMPYLPDKYPVDKYPNLFSVATLDFFFSIRQIIYIALFSALLSRLTALACGST